MKRVLYVDLSPSPGGSNISLYHLIAGLDRSRYQPLAALSAINPFDWLDRLDLPVMRVRTPRWEDGAAGLLGRVRDGAVGDGMRRRDRGVGPRLWRAAGSLRRLQRDLLPVTPALLGIVRRFQPALIHLNDAPPLVRAGLLAGRLSRTPALCHCRSFVLPGPADNRWLLPGLGGLIFISQAVATAQLSAMDAPAHQRVIPNAVNPADFDLPDDPAWLRAEFGLPADARVVGMVGRILPWKGQHVFVDALARLSGRFPGLHGLIVGFAEEVEGPGYAARVRQQAEDLGLANRLHLVGFRQDVPRLLGGLDMLVHCSTEPEPFGRTVIEGMAAGRPVIASDAGGAAEIVTAGVDGLLVPPGNAGALAEAIGRLLDDPALSARLGNAARETVLRHYTVERHVAAVQDFYDEVLAGL